MTTIWLDMDGTLADLYGVKDWLPKLRAYDPSPYKVAVPLVNMAALARILNNRRKAGYRVCIISALSKDSTPAYDAAVKEVKTAWLKSTSQASSLMKSVSSLIPTARMTPTPATMFSVTMNPGIWKPGLAQLFTPPSS